MFIGVETNERGKALDMRHISECLPAWLMDEVAARGHDGAHKFVAGETNCRGNVTAVPTRHGSGLTPDGASASATPPARRQALRVTGAVKGKGRSNEAPASVLGGTSIKESPAYKEPSPAPKGRPVLMLVEGNRCLDTAKTAALVTIPRRQVVSRHLVLVGGTHYATSP